MKDDVRSANLLFFYCADVLEREQRQVLCTPHGLLNAGHDACALAPFVQLATQSLRLDLEGADFASSKGTLAALAEQGSATDECCTTMPTNLCVDERDARVDDRALARPTDGRQVRQQCREVLLLATTMQVRRSDVSQSGHQRAEIDKPEESGEPRDRRHQTGGARDDGMYRRNLGGVRQRRDTQQPAEADCGIGTEESKLEGESHSNTGSRRRRETSQRDRRDKWTESGHETPG